MAHFNPYLNFHRPCGFATVEVMDNGKRRRHYRLVGLPHALRKAGLARQVGAALEGRHQRRHARTASTADERHRMRPPHAATQATAAGQLPLPLVNPSTTARGLAAPDSALMGGGGGSSTNVRGPGHSRLRFPLPLTPLPLEHPQKGDPLAAPAPRPINPISGSFLDWKMLAVRLTNDGSGKVATERAMGGFYYIKPAAFQR